MRTLRPLHRTACAGLTVLLAAQSTPASAGPPFVTDDPEPTDTGRWEVYSFVSATQLPGEADGAAGLDLNYGALRDLQLTATAPIGFRAAGPTRLGLGDVELAAKYRFLHQRPGSWIPDVAVFPRLFTPSGQSTFGSGGVSLLLPVWAQKDLGSWSVFGGGGYSLNGGQGGRNAWIAAAAISRAVTPRFALGAEVYHQGADAQDARDYTGLNVGLTYRVTEHWSLLASGGPGLQNARRQGQSSVYVALKADY